LQIGLAPSPLFLLLYPQAKLSQVNIGSCSGFMKTMNAGSCGNSLVKARIHIPEAVLKLHAFRDGRMKKIDRIPMPYKTTVLLRPAGYHVMICSMPKEVKEGSEVIATMSFETGS